MRGSMTDGEIRSRVGMKDYWVLSVTERLRGGYPPYARMLAAQLEVVESYSKFYYLPDLSQIYERLSILRLVLPYWGGREAIYVITEDGVAVLRRVEFCAKKDQRVWGKYVRESQSPNIHEGTMPDILRATMQFLDAKKKAH